MGVGWIGDRATIGLADAPDHGINGGFIAAHEMGHNLGRWHSPCAVAYDLDPFEPYPYSPDAIIANIGLDITNLTDFTLVPATYHDIMGYCEQAWISDFTYTRLMANQISVGSSAAAMPEGESLFIRAKRDENGAVTWMPSYRLTGTPTQPAKNSLYKIELLSEDGAVVGAHPVGGFTSSDSGTTRLISAVIPLPAEKFSIIRLLEGENMRAENRIRPQLRRPNPYCSPTTRSRGRDAAFMGHSRRSGADPLYGGRRS